MIFQRPCSTPAWKRTELSCASSDCCEAETAASAIGKILERQIDDERAVLRLDEFADRGVARQRRIGSRQDQVGLRRGDGVEIEAFLAYRPLQNLEHRGGGREVVLDRAVFVANLSVTMRQR